MNDLLQLKNICKSYQNGPDSVQVLRGVNLTIQSGETVAITGPSGSGKSTLMNLIGMLDAADSGTFTFQNEEVGGFDEEQSLLFRREKVGVVFQKHHLLPQCTALENVMLPSLNSEKSAENIRDRAEKLLKKAGLAERMHHFPGQLSGGECQRVAVVRALINEPVLLLADEPTGALDKKSTQELIDLLKIFNSDGMTILMVTHSDFAANAMQTRYLLDDGILKSGN